MNVASLELCKELYELSGWRNHGEVTFADNARDTDDVPEERTIPRYDLGYLIRKLPGEINAGDEEEPEYQGLFLEPSWVIGYSNQPYPDQQLSCTADTPEDCAAKLCIELFKQGVLKNV